MWSLSEPGATEVYMMPGAESNPNMTFASLNGGVEYSGNELPVEYMFDQGLNYQVPSNYGYYCAVYEPPGEWPENRNALGSDGQDLHYLGMQAENVPYVYYAPSYGYSQPPYTQYNPYLSATGTGIDGSYIGSQQYLNNPSFPSPVSSPAYYPVIVQPDSDFVPASTLDPFAFGSGASICTRPPSAGIKIKAPQSSINETASSRASDPPIPSSRRILEISKPSEASHANLQSSRRSSAQEPVIDGSDTVLIQSSGKAVTSSSRGSINYGPNTRGWAGANKNVRGVYEIVANGNKDRGILGELSWASRTSRSQSNNTSESVDVAEGTKKSASDVQANIIINADHYNREEFAIDYQNAKFFVIKSYSEDDVHKSIKYNVWSSTPNGNKRLDSAFEDAKRLSTGKPKICPVFLFFSVNASGQFCGVAEMLGPVDFSKDMDFWQQDKWSGSFPVKWHMIKDVPNSSLRHIILENNENKPVTHSRDTQEIPYTAGMNMLKIFKNSLPRTSILDDFPFYEERQRKMLEDKLKHLGRSFSATPYVPAVVLNNKLDAKIDKSRKENEHQLDITNAVGNQPYELLHRPSKSNKDQQATCLPCKVDEKHTDDAVNQPAKAETKQSNVTDSFKVNADFESSVRNHPPETDPKQTDIESDHKVKTNGKMSKSFVNQSTKSDREQAGSPTKQHLKADLKSPNATGYQPSKPDSKQLSSGNFIKPKDIYITGKSATGVDQAKQKVDASLALAEKNAIKASLAKGSELTNSDLKDELLSVNLPKGKVEDSGTTVFEVFPTDVVKIGSVDIKVPGLAESSGNVPTFRMVESKGAKLNKNGMLAGSTQQEK